VLQHIRDFRRFEINKRDLVHQREDPILVADENITYEIQERHCQLTYVLALCLITS
jgi:hypothetical protein